MDYRAPRRFRYLFWLIIGALSTALPEVIAGSDLFPFFKLTDYLLVIPLYSLHTLVLWYFIWSNGKPRFYNLFPAGAIFGLYEAYMTKVIWDPSWSAYPLKFFGMAVVETLILVFFWHSFLAFIVPLFVAEIMLTSSREMAQGLPEWMWKKMIGLQKGKRWIVIPLIAGLFQGINTPTLQDASFSGLSNTIIMLTLIYLWKKIGGNELSFRSLLPTDGEFRVLLTILLFYYVFMGLFWRPESLPGLESQVAVWVLYLIFGGLLFLGLRKSQVDEKLNPNIDLNIRTMNLLIFGVVFSFSALLGKATGLSVIAVYLVWFGGIIFGIFNFIKVIRTLCE